MTRVAGAAKSVIVVGGGIAGIAAALRLAESGVRVTLLETRRKLGGRATSFQDVRSGLTIDNCQHVALGCCTNYLDFCRRLGVLDQIEWHSDIFWYEEGGRRSVLKPGLFPAPGHLTETFLGAKFLTMREKTAIGAAMLAALRADRDAERDRTFEEWLKDHAQPPGAIEKFWSPVVISACNLDVSHVSAASALHVFADGFLANRDAPAMGVSRVPLVDLYDRAESAITAAGGELRLGSAADEVGVDWVKLGSGERLNADRAIRAVPFERAVRIVSAELRGTDARFPMMEKLTHSPILGVHLAFDAPVLPTHSAVLVARPTQWLFRKDAEGRMVHAVISAADEWISLDEAEITRRVLADIHACLPASRSVTLRSSRPVKEKLATFAPTPESERSRPSTTGSSGLILAGDYVQTGWPATMEGAVRSGSMAAAAVLGRDVQSEVLPGLPMAPIARWIAG